MVRLAHRFHGTFTLGFTQPDPSRRGLNNYTYAACAPVDKTDPSGLIFCWSAGGIFTALGFLSMAISWNPLGWIAGSLGMVSFLMGGGMEIARLAEAEAASS
ncbi:hypothetical protein ABZ234_01310 [Nocardiopsis sp. NPDC006198]|uniref:hypothetical protein n=1 Tax=Nocardiopsis sp. NPDC006198 TaxID=3154472 RepID=UPI0033AAC2B4